MNVIQCKIKREEVNTMEMICKTINNARDGLKSQIFITAGKRSAACGEKTSTTRCLKGRTKKQKLTMIELRINRKKIIK